MTLSYSVYGNEWGEEHSHEWLLKMAKEWGDLIARAEFSGSEGCYVEVARYSQARKRWERYCFEKVFGGEHPSDPSRPENGDHPRCLSAHETAEKFAAEINEAGFNTLGPLIHNLPNWLSP